MKFVYHPDHDKRYAHISKFDRPDYPDEIIFSGEVRVKRVKPFAELTVQDFEPIAGSLNPAFAACDVPVSSLLD